MPQQTVTELSNQVVKTVDNGLGEFFAKLFVPKEFTSHLLERSFRQPEGWIELGLVLAIMLLTFWLSAFWLKKYAHKKRSSFFRHIGRRLLWPILMLIGGIATLYIWNTLDLKAVWLRLLVLAAHWMIIIRVVLATVHAALPRHRITDWLERSLSAILWIMFLLWVSGIDDIIISWMKDLSFSVGSSKLNLYTMVTGLLWVGVVVMLAMWLAKFIQNLLMNNQHLNPNLRIMISNIVRIVLVILSIMIALPLVGIDLTVLSVFGGALGVGIGFGLQKIASNYISGFMILGDRSIRPGDRLTVDNFTGYVTQITARFVVLRNASGAEALIPNETFITNTVINESYTGKALWQSLDVQVAYSSDIVKAMTIMQEAAAHQERVDTDPAPSAFLTTFADNGINLRVGFWVKDPENGYLGLFSAILLEIWQRFNEEGIEFPFPQREVRILNEAAEPDAAALLRAQLKAQSDTTSQEPGHDDD